MAGLSGVLLGGAAIMLIRWIRAGTSPEPPFELRALLLLMLSMAAIDVGFMVIAPTAREQFLSRFGDLGISSPILASALTAVVVHHTNGRRWLFIGLMALISLVHGFSPRYHSSNPTGPDSEWLGVIVPLLCVLVLLSPRVGRYCSSGTPAIAN